MTASGQIAKMFSWQKFSLNMVYKLNYVPQRVGTNSGLDYWNGTLDWTTGMEHWTDYWNELFEFLQVFLPFVCACLIVTQHTSYAWIVYILLHAWQ